MMPGMNNQTLPIPNPGDWLTLNAAAEFLGVSRRTLLRMVEKRALTAYSPYGGFREKSPTMFWRADVAVVEQARTRLGARAKADA